MTGDGRPRESGTPLRPEQAKATVRALEQLKAEHNWTDKVILDELGRFGEKLTNKDVSPHRLDEIAFSADPSTIYRIIGRTPRSNTPIIKGLFLWISKTYGKIYKELENEEILSKKDPDIIPLRTAFGYSGGHNHPDNIAWKGRYKLYRPYHEDPRSLIQLTVFEIGMGKSPFDCHMKSASNLNRLGKTQKFNGVGRMVPWSDDGGFCALSVDPHHSKPPKGNYMLHLYDPEWTGDEPNTVLAFRGIMISAVGDKKPPSSWPFYALRADEIEKIVPHVLTESEFSELPNDVREQLGRGGVYWRSEDALAGRPAFYRPDPPGNAPR